MRAHKFELLPIDNCYIFHTAVCSMRLQHEFVGQGVVERNDDIGYSYFAVGHYQHE